MNKYHNGKIYKVVDVGYNKCYIGSTTESLSQRMARHRASYNHFLKGNKRHSTSCVELFDEYGVENCKIELIVACKCETKDELLREEGKHIKNIDCVNKVISGRTRKEYLTDKRIISKNTTNNTKRTTKKKLRKTTKIYHQNNRDKILERVKKHYQDNKEHYQEYKRQWYLKKKAKQQHED